MATMKSKFDKDFLDEVETQINDEQHTIYFDTKEFTVELLWDFCKSRRIVIPDYKRNIVWTDKNMSKFIESLLLGIPIPHLFALETEEGNFEIIDGRQRIESIGQFIDNKLKLVGLDKLDKLNGFKYNDLPAYQQRKFNHKTLRMIVLFSTERSVCFDIYLRISEQSIPLTPSEFRRGAFKGSFYDIIMKLKEDKKFIELCPLSRQVENRGEREELLVRFYAYSDSYMDFKHDVQKFLDNYVIKQNHYFESNPILVGEYEERFYRLLNFIGENFKPIFFKKNKNDKTTHRVRFEALSVGAYFALQQKPDLRIKNIDWLFPGSSLQEYTEFDRLTRTHSSNSPGRLRSRIEFVRDKLLENAINE
jgi:hypothetical protein